MVKKTALSIYGFIFLFFVPTAVLAAGGLAENFDSYTLGDISGQGGWTSDCGFTVLNSQSTTEPNSLQNFDSSCSAQSPDFDSSLSGDQQFDVMNFNTGSAQTSIWFNSLIGTPFVVRVTTTQIVLVTDLDEDVISDTVSSWVHMELRWDTGFIQARADGGAWSTPRAITSVPVNIQVFGDDSPNVYLDSFDSPTGGSSSSASSLNIYSSGSLILLHTACNTFAGTGADSTCTHEDTSIEIPAIRSVVRQFTLGQLSIGTQFGRWIMVGVFLFLCARWIFRIFTLKRPDNRPRYRR